MNLPSISMRCAPAILLLALLLPLSEGAHGRWSVPNELRAQVGLLSDDQIEFITSGAALKFLPEQQLKHELATRDAASLQNLLNDLMSLADEMSYDPERDMGATPLNIASKRFNGGTLPTPPPLRELERNPGPFSVHRYLFPQSGVPTFAGAKVAIWPEDLVAGKVDVAIIGVPSNASSGRRDAANGPNAMRTTNTIASPDMQSLVKPHEVLSVADYGDFSVDGLSIELSIDHVTDMVAETAATGAIPMLVGGDTSMLYPGVKGIARAHGNASFGLLHFNAHPDTEQFGDHTISDRQSLFRLLDEGVVNGSETVQVGLRGPAVNVETLQWLRNEKVRYHTMTEIQQTGFDKVLRRVIREVDKGPEAFFVSIDVSVIDPAEMIAAGRVASNGLRISEVTQAIRHVCAAKDIVGFEITDMAPMMDSSRVSVVNANAILNACLVGIAVRKSGLDPDYVHPFALDHGQR
jgi:arginase family enzyme